MIERQHLAIRSEGERLGILTAAAERLNVTQSALSHIIKMLEDAYGIKIWTKIGRGLRFTQAGHYLLSMAQRVFPQIEHAEHVLRDFSLGLKGSLRVGMECHTCQKWLSRLPTHFLPRSLGAALDIHTAFRFRSDERHFGHKLV